MKAVIQIFVLFGMLGGAFFAGTLTGGDPRAAFTSAVMKDTAAAVADVSAVVPRIVDIRAKKLQTLGGLDLTNVDQHEEAVSELAGALFEALKETKKAVAPLRRTSLTQVLTSIQMGTAVLAQEGSQYLKAAAAARGGVGEDEVGKVAPPKFSGRLAVTVKSKPFGMHIRVGTTDIVEVWQDFPAYKAGVRAGCKLVEIDGTPCDASSWLSMFEVSQPPFPITVECKAKEEPAAPLPKTPTSADEHRCTVEEKPFGMNVQVTEDHPYPRVIEVLPGFPAEKAGVRVNMILTEVNGMKVTSETWFSSFQHSDPPFPVAFNTSMLEVLLDDDMPEVAEEGALQDILQDAIKRYGADVVETHQFQVLKKPFGMHVMDDDEGLPRVKEVLPGMPASEVGIQVGDIIYEIAGSRVTGLDWFGHFQTAVAPFGIRVFRVPEDKLQVVEEAYADEDEPDEPGAPNTTTTTPKPAMSEDQAKKVMEKIMGKSVSMGKGAAARDAFMKKKLEEMAKRQELRDNMRKTAENLHKKLPGFGKGFGMPGGKGKGKGGHPAHGDRPMGGKGGRPQG